MTFPRFLDCAYVLLHDDFNMDLEKLREWAPQEQERDPVVDVAAKNTASMQMFQKMMRGTGV